MALRPLPPEMADLKEELLMIVKGGILFHPRSQQKLIGPSEIGTPCDLKLALKLQQHAGWNPRDANWRSTIGVAGHRWMEETFSTVLLPDGTPRFLLETQVDVGEIDGQVITGSSDVYDRCTDTIIDWKFVGPSSLHRKKAHGPGQTYTWQGQLYGRGFERAGLPVKHILIVAWPTAGELSDALFMHLPYDRGVAEQALARADRIAKAVRLLGPATVLPQLARAEDYCHTCAFYNPGSPTVLNGCPGARNPAAAARAVANQLSGIVPGY